MTEIGVQQYQPLRLRFGTFWARLLIFPFMICLVGRFVRKYRFTLTMVSSVGQAIGKSVLSVSWRRKRMGLECLNGIPLKVEELQLLGICKIRSERSRWFVTPLVQSIKLRLMPITVFLLMEPLWRLKHLSRSIFFFLRLQ